VFVVVALAGVTGACGNPQPASSVSGADGPTTTSEGDPISDAEFDAALSDPAYGDVAGLARVKLIAIGGNDCADWDIHVRDPSDDDDNSLLFVFKRNVRLEKRQGDGIFGVDGQGVETLLTKEHRGKLFKSFRLKVQTHNLRDGMVFLRKGGGNIEVSGEYKKCSGGAARAFPDKIIAMADGKTRWDVTNPDRTTGELMTKVKVPETKKDKKKKGSGSGSSN